MYNILSTLERTRIKHALLKSGFIEELGTFYGSSFKYKIKSTVDHQLLITISSNDSIQSIVERIAAEAFRQRAFTRTSRREIYSLSQKVNRQYNHLLKEPLHALS